jgi:predicted CXXCH cytochrome family protein
MTRAKLLRKATQDLCLSCHANIKERMASAHPHAATDDCLACHQPHPSPIRHLLKAGAPGQCDTCHDVSALSKTHGDLPLKAAACATCHNPHGSKDKGMLRDRHHAPLAPGSCADCHAPSTGDKVQLTKPAPGLCLDCHGAIPGPGIQHQPVKAGECLTCHMPHAGNAKGLLKAVPQELCLQCHTGLVKGKSQHTPFREGACLDCHKPHESAEKKLLSAPIEKLCLQCHEDLIKGKSHRALGGECLACRSHSSPIAPILKQPAIALCAIATGRGEAPSSMHLPRRASAWSAIRPMPPGRQLHWWAAGNRFLPQKTVSGSCCIVPSRPAVQRLPPPHGGTPKP